MLFEYREEQNIAYKIISNELEKDLISHAYIIESNGYPKAYDFSVALAKSILCPVHSTKKENCLSECSQCKKIDACEFIELKRIDPVGSWIKKSQLDELQINFSEKPLIGNKRVYIINEADKMNTSSANSILKFLEEPEPGIVAILVVDNVNQLLDTIISRCQVISLKHQENFNTSSTVQIVANAIYNKQEEVKNFIIQEEENKSIFNVLEFLKRYEQEKSKVLLCINKYFFDFFKTREDVYNAFYIMLLFYKDVLNQKITNEIKIFKDYQEYISFISKINELDVIVKKINIINELITNIKFNVNLNMLMDKLIISLEGCENND